MRTKTLSPKEKLLEEALSKVNTNNATCDEREYNVLNETVNLLKRQNERLVEEVELIKKERIEERQIFRQELDRVKELFEEVESNVKKLENKVRED